MPALTIAIAIFAGLFAFSWVITCMVTGARYDAARDREWAAFNGRPRCGSGAANKRRQLLGCPSLSHGGGGYKP